MGKTTEQTNAARDAEQEVRMKYSDGGERIVNPDAITDILNSEYGLDGWVHYDGFIWDANDIEDVQDDDGSKAVVGFAERGDSYVDRQV